MRADPDAYPFERVHGCFYLGCAESDPLPAVRPLIAYGANASPAALAAKVGATPVMALAGTLRGWAVVHSAHISPYGAVPATIVPRDGASAVVCVLLCADLRALDASEPNYERLALHDLDLSAERLGAVGEADAYVSRHGPLLIDGETVDLGARPQAQLADAVRRLSP